MTHYTVPNIRERLNVFQEVSLGGAAVFRCRFGAHPRAEVRWFKDDRPIAGDSRFSIGEESSLDDSWTDLCLTIKEVTKGDEGSYRCSVENSEGVASTTGYLFVIDPTSSVIDPGPIDQSLIDALLRQASQSDLQAFPDRSRHSNSVLESNGSTALTADSTTKDEGCLFVDEDSTTPSNAPDSEPTSRRPSKPTGVKNSDRTVINVYTILNFDDNFHDSFRPIEVAAFESGAEARHIPADVSSSMFGASLGEHNNNSGRSNNNNNNNTPEGTPPDMDASAILRPGTPSAGELETDKSNYFHWKSDNEISRGRRDPAKGSASGRRVVQPRDDLKKRKDYTKMAEWESLVKEVEQARGKKATDAKNAKSLKWLKVRSGSSDSICLKSGDEDKAETSSIIARRRVPKPIRKVSYIDAETVNADDAAEPSTGPNPFRQGHNFKILKTTGREPPLTWHMAFTNLFRFPKVVGVFFVLASTLAFLFLNFNPYLVTFLVSLLWLFFIQLHPYLTYKLEVRP